MSTMSIASQIIALLYEKGPLTMKDLAKGIPFAAKSIQTKVLELENKNLVRQDNDGVWSLMPGVTTETKENPTTKITLCFRDGASLSFGLAQPVPQRQMMKWIGRFLVETNNPMDVGLPE